VIARSWLFAPGHNERLLAKVFTVGADEVILDLEDGVPEAHKDTARQRVADALAERPAWVRVNAVRSDVCVADLAAVRARARGIRIPKAESAEDVDWVVARAPGLPMVCAIESARGVANAPALAAHPAVTNLALGVHDLARDLGVDPACDEALLFARSALVIASRAAGIDPPVDGVHGQLDDDAGLERAAQHAAALGFFGKSAVHPRQLAVLHRVFTPTAAQLAWAERVVRAFDESAGAPTQLEDGEFVDRPVADRARRLLTVAR